MESTRKERHFIMINRFQVENLKCLLRKYNKSEIGNENVLRERVNILINEQGEDEGFDNFMWTIYHKVLRQTFRSLTLPPPQQTQKPLKTKSKTIALQLEALSKKPKSSVEDTGELIKKYFEGDEACEIDGGRDSILVSLSCPIGKTRINIPARGKKCLHLQCFDAETFLIVAEKTKKPFSCPICAIIISPDSIIVDGYFEQILQDVEEANKVLVYPDYGWSQVLDEKVPVPDDRMNDDLVVLEEVKKPAEPTRRTVREPVVEPPVAAEDMLQIVEIND